MSNPQRYSLNVEEDRKINLFGGLGLGCTLTGLAVLMTAVGYNTRTIPSQYRTNTNRGLGVGVLLQLIGLLLSLTGEVSILIVVAFVIASLPAMVWGCMNYAQGKGISSNVGWLGILGVVGLILLMVLPNNNSIPIDE